MIVFAAQIKSAREYLYCTDSDVEMHKPARVPAWLWQLRIHQVLNSFLPDVAMTFV